MISEKAVEHIESYGSCQDDGVERKQILAEMDFPVGQKAEYVIIAGCFHAQNMSQAMKALKNVLDHFKVSYTLLEKEYCCGWMTIGQPAVMSKNEEDIAQYRKLSKDFVVQNFKQAKELGARSIALYCGACEPTYTNYQDLTDLGVISYNELLDRYFKGGKLDKEVDYFAGCYRFRRRITDKALDVEPARRVLEKIEGLKVNYLDNKLCCYIPPHLEQLTASIKTDTVVNICTGCYYSLKTNLAGKKTVQVKMLPEVVWEAIRSA